MVGFVQTMPKLSSEVYTMTEHKISCFWGEQETHYDMEKTVSVKTDSDTVKIAVITTQNKIVTDADEPKEVTNVQLDSQVSTGAMSMAQTTATSQTLLRNGQSSKRFNAHISHVPTDETDKAISFINAQDLGWKADTCKLSKDHA
jgi:hypothetical protein